MMALYVLDTDILTLARRGHAQVVARVLAMPRSAVTTTIVTIEEQISGWYAELRRAKDLDHLERAYRALLTVINDAANITVLPFTRPALEQAKQLRKMYPRIGRNDLSIAAIALEHGGVLVTRNQSDFENIVGLKTENWAV